jgi:hypothetical protein
MNELQSELTGLSEEQIDIVRRVLFSSIDTGIHDFLFQLQEQADLNNDIEIKVDGINIIEASDGLNGELFTEDGWLANFSKYGETKEE